MAKIVVYRSRRARRADKDAALKESGVDFDAVDYYTDPIPEDEAEGSASEDGDQSSRAASHQRTDLQDAENRRPRSQRDAIIDLMVEHPDLIQRPIVEKGVRAILARPAERLKEIVVVPRATHVIASSTLCAPIEHVV
jgi:arsenate reductase